MAPLSHTFAPPQVTLPLSAPTFPFPYELSLKPLIAFWQQGLRSEHAVERALAAQVQQALQEAPQLQEPITDVGVIRQHQALVDVLMSVVFPRASWESMYSAALWPFQLRSFYATPLFTRFFTADDGRVRGRANVDETMRNRVRTLYAYALMLSRVYGLDIEFAYPLIYTATDPETGLDCHFKVVWDTRFLEVCTVGDLPPLTDTMRTDILASLGDPQALMALLPPEQFVFKGFLVLQALEVTDQEVLSSLKRDLIDRESLVSLQRFDHLQEKLRTLFRRPALRFSLTARQGEQVYHLRGGSQMANHCLYADSQHYTCQELVGSAYERVLLRGELVLIDDLMTYNVCCPVEETWQQQGFRNLVVAPLVYQDTIIGALELASPHRGDLHAMNIVKLQEVLPLFAMAVRRSTDELNTRIQAVIKEQCTAIHPAVEWRFRQAAVQWINQRQHGSLIDMEPIVFEDVYPLYGVSDIRGSSTHRNAAIQADLIAHLRLARAILQLSHAYKALPILEELGFHVGRHMARLELGLGAGDEMLVLDFLRRQVEPVFPYLQTLDAEVAEQIDTYYATINPRLGTLYQQRKDFEESVTQLNEALASYLAREEDKAQAMCPHYFEQHKTDGIEYGIYVGASLIENGTFAMVHVHNLRLWQLLVACGLARRAEEAKHTLKVPLDMAHLILVQHTPLAVRFRFDEKRFDIDGAYNMRYEIIKKRIDKALIRDSTERLTQPGKIAIVYSQPQEAIEYKGYISYLQATGLLTDEVEEMELETLPGAHGLQALRVTVAMPTPGDPPPIHRGDLTVLVP